MTDALAPWANLGMLVVIGGIGTLVLIAAITDGDPGAFPGRRVVPRLVGAVAAALVLAAGIGVAAVAVTAPALWWFALYGWATWIGGEIAVIALLTLAATVDRWTTRTNGPGRSSGLGSGSAVG